MILHSIEDGYMIIYDKNRNQVHIHLPQTKETMENTVKPCSDRKVNINQSELTLLMNVARLIFNRG